MCRRGILLGSGSDAMAASRRVASAKARPSERRGRGPDGAFSISEIDRALRAALSAGVRVEVDEMPWTETSSKQWRHGQYSGGVDEMMRPHGWGSWAEEEDEKEATTAGGEGNHLFGWWHKGSFIPYEYLDRKFNGTCGKSERGNDFFDNWAPIPDRVSFARRPEARRNADRDAVERSRRRDAGGRSRSRAAGERSRSGAVGGREARYELGDNLRSRDDVVDRRADADEHLGRISDLGEGDRAFVIRSDGITYTYAEVREKRFDHECGEGLLVFRLREGSTKTVPQYKWKYCICIEKRPGRGEEQWAEMEDDEASDVHTC